MNLSSQKKISQTRSPRVQIVYDVDVSGEAKSVELPFVMGVMGDFSGDNANALPPVSERRFHELDIHHFDQFMADIAPQVSVKVPNELSGNGLLQADLTFRRMEDFNPDEVARQIPSLAKLLEAREKLSALLAYMDGKSGAEELLGQILNDKALLLAIDKRSSEAQQADEAKLTKSPQL